jgi:hypothetical protein
MLPFDVTARIGHRMRLEQANLQRLALEQRLAGDFHGPSVCHAAVAKNGLLMETKHASAREALPIEVASPAFLPDWPLPFWSWQLSKVPWRFRLVVGDREKYAGRTIDSSRD